jgi:hypothetical protein
MLGPFLWVLHSLSNSVRPWDLPLRWIPLWARHWTFFSAGSSPFLSLYFFQRGIIMGQSCDCSMATPSLTWCPISLLEVGSIISLYIQGPSLWVLRVSHLLGLWCILEDSHNLLPPEVACFHSFCWPSGLQSFSLTQYQIRFPFCPPNSPTCPLSLPGNSTKKEHRGVTGKLWIR